MSRTSCGYHSRMMSRREFLEGVSASSLLSVYPERTRRVLQDSAAAPPSAIKPKALAPGMTVALVAPASHLFDPDAYRRAEERVRSLGFRTRVADGARQVHGYLAGADDVRARDFNAAFADDGVDAVWCLRGGYGALRILPHLDYEVVRKHPKALIGYSDITALHVALNKLCGLVCFHGPMPSVDLSTYTVHELTRVAGAPRAAGEVGRAPDSDPAPGSVDHDARIVTIAGGRARGSLTGGNLSLITRLLGTPFEPDLAGRILFLEDVGEAAYRIDGMLAQLRLSGKLKACAGIALGRFTDADGGGQPVKLPLETVFRELLGDLEIPVYWGLASGHVQDQTTLPYGVEAEIDADAGTLKLLDSAVI